MRTGCVHSDAGAKKLQKKKKKKLQKKKKKKKKKKKTIDDRSNRSHSFNHNSTHSALLPLPVCTRRLALSLLPLPLATHEQTRCCSANSRAATAAPAAPAAAAAESIGRGDNISAKIFFYSFDGER
jgi:hypothetical protein